MTEQNALGLTVRVGNLLGIILDRQANDYLVELENGDAVTTAHVMWETEIPADPELALFRRENRTAGRLVFTGDEWDLHDDEMPMPEMPGPDGTRLIWDPSSCTYVTVPNSQQTGDRTNSTPGNNELFDPAQDSGRFKPKNPLMEGWMAKTATDDDWGEFGDDAGADEGNPTSEQEVAQPLQEVGRFVVVPTGQVFIGHGQTYHDQIMEQNGIDPNQGVALGVVMNDGTAQIVQASENFPWNQQAVEQSLEQGFGTAIKITYMPQNLRSSQPEQAAATEPFSITTGSFMNTTGTVSGMAWWVKDEEMPPGAVLLAEHTRPQDEANIHKAKAVLEVSGGVGSHAAVLAKTTGKPTVVGVGDDLYQVEDGATVNIQGNQIQVIPQGHDTKQMYADQYREQMNAPLMQVQPNLHDYMRNRLTNKITGDLMTNPAHIIEQMEHEAGNPSLDNCPSCADPMVETSGEKSCHSCGHRQPIITTQAGLLGDVALALPWLAGPEVGAPVDAAMMGGEAAAGAAGAGEMGGLMNSAMRGGAFQAGKGLVGGGGSGGGGEQGGQQPGTDTSAAGTISHHFLYGSGAFGEDEVGGANKNDGNDDDPDHDGEKGFREENRADAPENLGDVNDTGGTKQDSNEEMPGLHDTPEGAMVIFELAKPLVKHFAENPDQDGSNNPVLQAIDQMLEQHFPGYRGEQGLDSDGDAEAIKLDDGGGNHDHNEEEKVAGNIGMNPMAPGATPMAPAPAPMSGPGMPGQMPGQQPGMAGTPCPMCGQIHQPGTPCPQPHDPTAPNMAPGGAQGQMSGPYMSANLTSHIHYAAAPDLQSLAEYLTQQGYSVEFAPDGSLVVHGAAEDGIGDVSVRHEPPVNDQHLTHRIGLFSVTATRCQECGAPHNPEQPFCESCGSSWPINAVPKNIPENMPDTPVQVHDTGPFPDRPPRRNRFKTDDAFPSSVSSWRVIADGDVLDMHQRREIEHQRAQHGHEAWLDEMGRPLQPDHDYLMKAPSYAIPDHISVTHVTADKLVFTIHGEAGMDYEDSISKQDAELQGYEFQADQDEGDHDIAQPMDDSAPMDQDNTAQVDDLAHAASVDREFNPGALWLFEGSTVDVDPALMEKLAAKDYTPREQREFIDESGTARNIEKLDLAETHYLEDDIDDHLALW